MLDSVATEHLLRVRSCPVGMTCCVGVFRRWETRGLVLSLVTSQAGAAFYTGLLTEGSGEKPGIRKWKVNSESQVEALDKEEDKAGGAAIKEPKEPQGKASSKKNFICKACEKSFHFYCRLKVHMKRCRVARGKQIQCKECTEVKSTKKELEKHQLEVHGEVGMAKKKKKRLPVTCDICGREFAHASGRVGDSREERGVCSRALCTHWGNPSDIIK